MSNFNGRRQETLARVVDQLCRPDSYSSVAHYHDHDVPMPSIEVLAELMEILRSVIFPGYFGNSEIKPHTMHYYIGAALDRCSIILHEQIRRGFCFDCGLEQGRKRAECEEQAAELTVAFIAELPEIRRLLAGDVQAAFNGDPAARDRGEIIFCYPSIRALTNHRVAHVLHRLEVPLIPRIISEMAHSETGIDIHPGARIGENFFMDHGTGIVIGETCRIGDNVRVYQGVTLGARSFPLDGSGQPIKGIKRHPTVEDEVTIYSGATILGTVTIGRAAVIGGNVWLTRDVPARTRVLQGGLDSGRFDSGAGI